VFFAQGRNFPCQKPDELNAVCRCAGNEVVVPNVRNLVYGCVISVHTHKVSFLPLGIKQIILLFSQFFCHLMGGFPGMAFPVPSQAQGWRLMLWLLWKLCTCHTATIQTTWSLIL